MMASVGFSHSQRSRGLAQCSVCLRDPELNDARLLPCQHRLCASCVDRLSVSTRTARLLQCPLCRVQHQIPNVGAKSLPTSPPSLSLPSVCSDNAPESLRTCVVCRGVQKSKAKFTCSTCFSPLCKDHAVYHVTSSPGTHSIKLLAAEAKCASAVAGRWSRASPSTDSCQMCPSHDEPMHLYCLPCDAAVCEYCTAIGEHVDHKPVKAVEEVVEQRKNEAAQTVQHLQGAVARDLQHSLQVLDNAKKQLAQRATIARRELHSSADRLRDMVRCCLQQKLDQVDELERVRLYEISDKQEEVAQQLGAISRAANFFDRVVDKSEGKHATDVLGLFTRRAASLVLVEQPPDLQTIANISLQNCSSEEEVLALISSYMGEVKKDRE